MDDADRAQERMEFEMERTISAARAAVASGVSATHCHECGDEIHPERRAALAGCQYCADCAAELERLDHRARRAGL